MSVLVEVPLGIEDIKVEETEENEFGDVFLQVSSTKEGEVCRICGEHTEKTYGHNREIWLRHLSVFGKRSFIRIKPKRCQCTHCKGRPTVTQKLSWYSSKSPNTLPFENHILLSLAGSTISDVSIKEDTGYDATEGIINRHIGDETDRERVESTETPGIDEVSLKKGHGGFVTIISSLTEGGTKILGVIKGREKEKVKDFLKKFQGD